MLRLFINNIEVEFTKQPDILFNYTAEDTSNPTVVKTMFSKTVQVPKTANNNKIFGHIDILDRLQTNQNYSPSAKYEFYLLNDGDLIERGYVKLDKITNNNYELSLFGGLGSFFYSLMYNEEGDKRKLSDLTWHTIFHMDNQPASDDEFGFELNAQNVFNAMSYLPSNKSLIDGSFYEDIDVWDWVNFAPAYNGFYGSNFDSDKALIYFGNGDGFFTGQKYKQKTENKTTFSLYNSLYARADLSTELTEWQVRDLRAYQQRPVFRMMRFLEACTYPENNGGYNVRLDPDFFNDKNPYFTDTWVALPKFDELVKEQGGSINIESEIKYNGSPSLNTVFTDNSINITPYNYSSDNQWVMNGTTWSRSYLDKDGNTKDIPYSAGFSIKNRFKLNIYKDDGGKIIRFGRNNFSGKKQSSSLAVQLVAYNAQNNQPVAYSPIYNFTDNNNPLEYGDWKYGDKSKFLGETVNTIKGYFQNKYFVDRYADYNSVFELAIEEVPICSEGVYFKINVSKGCNKQELNGGSYLISEQPGWKPLEDNVYDVLSLSLVMEPSIANSNFGEYSNLNKLLLSKKLIFSQEITPADYLLSYCKLFGLKFLFDKNNRDIYILTRNNYYKNEIVNIEDKIDLSDEISMSPLTYNYRFFNMQLETPETAYSEKYKTKYDVEYGMKQINTNYNFNTEEQNLFENNVYKNGITVLDNSNAYYNWRNGDLYLPTINTNMYEYVLFSGTGTDLSESKMYMYPYNNADRISSQSFNGVGNDAFPKMCYFDEENGLADFANCLLFRNGNKALFDGEGKKIYYTITDDIEEMYILNSNPCYLISAYVDPYSTDPNNSMHFIYSLPVYTKYLTETIKVRTNSTSEDDEYTTEVPNITDSLDFGSPREMYCGWTSGDETTLYTRFWKKFIEDQYSVDSRLISCNVLLEGKIDEEALRKFYYFGNSIWTLNAINDYNPTAKYTTSCDFIKVMDIVNYTEGQKSYSKGNYFETLTSLEDVPYGVEYVIRTQSSSGFYVSISNEATERQEIEYYTTINGQYLGQDSSSVHIKRNGDIVLYFDKNLIPSNIREIEMNITLDTGEETYITLNMDYVDTSIYTYTIGQTGEIVELTEDNGRIEIGAGKKGTLYVSSVFDTDFVFSSNIRNYIQPKTNYGNNLSIPAGDKVPVELRFVYPSGSSILIDKLTGTMTLYSKGTNDTKTIYIVLVGALPMPIEEE